MKRYRAAIVGCGNRSRAHIKAYELIGDAEVVACCAPSPARRDPLAAEFGLRAYADARTMIEKEKPDIVHLVLQPRLRVEPMTWVAERKVPLCTVEKPIAIGVADWKALCGLEAGSSTKFAVCHQGRWHRVLVKCREALTSGALGQVRFIDMAAGVNIADQGTHILNYGMSLNGDSPVVQVFGTASGTAELDSSHPAPDTTAGYLTFENGARALWINGHTGLDRRPSFSDKAPWGHLRIAAYAEKGLARFELLGTWTVISPGSVEQGDWGGGETLSQDNLSAQAGFHQAMFAWLEDEGKAPGTNLKQSLHEWKTVLALYASTVEHAPVDMSGFDPPEDLLERLRAVLKGN